VSKPNERSLIEAFLDNEFVFIFVNVNL